MPYRMLHRLQISEQQGGRLEIAAFARNVRANQSVDLILTIKQILQREDVFDLEWSPFHEPDPLAPRIAIPIIRKVISIQPCSELSRHALANNSGQLERIQRYKGSRCIHSLGRVRLFDSHLAQLANSAILDQCALQLLGVFKCPEFRQHHRKHRHERLRFRKTPTVNRPQTHHDPQRGVAESDQPDFTDMPAIVDRPQRLEGMRRVQSSARSAADEFRCL